jgi:hypothetical protein
VLVFHQAIARTPLRRPLDFTIHSLGGAAMAFCMWQAVGLLTGLFGQPTRLARFMLSFCFALSVGVFWEFAEQIADAIHDSHIQISISETMKDLWADTTGATVSLLLIGIVTRKRAA